MSLHYHTKKSPVIQALIKMQQATAVLIETGSQDYHEPVYALFLKDKLEKSLAVPSPLNDDFYSWATGNKEFLSLAEAHQFFDKLIINSCAVEVINKTG